MQWIFLIHFRKAVFHVISDDEICVFTLNFRVYVEFSCLRGEMSLVKGGVDDPRSVIL